MRKNCLDQFVDQYLEISLFLSLYFFKLYVRYVCICIDVCAYFLQIHVFLYENMLSYIESDPIWLIIMIYKIKNINVK